MYALPSCSTAVAAPSFAALVWQQKRRDGSFLRFVPFPQTAPSRHDGPHLGCPSDVSTQSQQRLETGVCVAVHSITKFCLNCLGRPRLLARLPKLTPFQTTVLVASAAVPAEGEYVAHGVFVPDHGLLEYP